MGDLQPWHIIILVVVLVVLFGAKRLPDASRSIGRSLRIFKAETKGLRGEDDEKSADATPTAAIAPPAPVAAQPVAAPAPAAHPVAAPAPAAQPVAQVPVAEPAVAAAPVTPAAPAATAPTAPAATAPAAAAPAASPLADLPFMQPTGSAQR